MVLWSQLKEMKDSGFVIIGLYIYDMYCLEEDKFLFLMFVKYSVFVEDL